MSSVPPVLSPRPAQHCPGNAWAGARSAGRLMILGAVLGLLAASGCARRAYTDVYVENMASEIRDLEDQLWEFDSEYRVLEQELDALQAENARLRSTLDSRSAADSSASNSKSAAPKNGSTQPRLLPVPGSSSTAPGGAAPSASPSSAPDAVPSLESLPDIRPNLPPASAVPPSGAAPATPGAALPSEPGAKRADPYDLENLAPPTIDQGEAMPPSLPAPKSDPTAPVTSNSTSALEVELGQIRLPAQLASATVEDGSDAPDRLAPAAEMPADTRVAEINFHPSLCRAVNLDAQEDADGVYLVLQPFNEARQFVPLPADLLIVAIDPARDGPEGRIGRWSLSSAEVETKLQPIGSSQGIHLSLPWTGPNPLADQVLVFVRYTMPDGRQIVGEHTIFVNDARRPNTVWVPRAKANAPGSNVRTASGERPVR